MAGNDSLNKASYCNNIKGEMQWEIEVSAARLDAVLQRAFRNNGVNAPYDGDDKWGEVRPIMVPGLKREWLLLVKCMALALRTWPIFQQTDKQLQFDCVKMKTVQQLRLSLMTLTLLMAQLG